MTTLHCDGHAVALEPGETVLDGLLRSKVAVSHSCRAGVCQSCLVKTTQGVAPEHAQIGLKETLKAQGYFLACVARPDLPLAITTSTLSTLSMPARIVGVEALSSDVLQVWLAPQSALEYQAGQFVSLVRADGLARSYSIANPPAADGRLELHVRRLPGGRMSQWLASPEARGASVAVRGPQGQCFYVAGRPTQNLVLAGTGTGLAPLVGVLKSALTAGHTGQITLFHGAQTVAGLYLRDVLQGLASAHAQFHYLPCVLQGDGESGLSVGPLDQVVAGGANVAGARVFLCGDPALVARMRRQVFLAGASLNDILADAFVTAPPPAGAVL